MLSKLLAMLVIAGPLMVARAGLTQDGEKYLAEAKKRISRIEKEIGEAKADARKADAAKDDLLACKRFLDNVQLEQPKHAEAAALQKKADGLLAQLKPVLVQSAIARRVGDIDDMIGIVEKELQAPAARDAAADEKLRDHFDLLRQMVREVLEKEPSNAKALAARDRENALWQEYRKQRDAAQKEVTP